MHVREEKWEKPWSLGSMSECLTYFCCHGNGGVHLSQNSQNPVVTEDIKHDSYFQFLGLAEAERTRRTDCQQSRAQRRTNSYTGNTRDWVAEEKEDTERWCRGIRAWEWCQYRLCHLYKILYWNKMGTDGNSEPWAWGDRLWSSWLMLVCFKTNLMKRDFYISINVQ